jgi:hypothetical protein
MASTRPLNYTTTVPVTQTVAECQAILAAAGASSASVHFKDGQPAGLSFSLDTPHGLRNFTLPVNTGGIHRVLAKAERDGQFAAARKKAGTFSSPEHAARVAWRVVKDWLEANLALIAAQMVTIDEVMLPWLHIQIGGEQRTLFEHYKAQERAALLPGDGDA